MSGVDDLKAEIGTIATDLTAEQDVINQVIAKLQGGGLSDADAEALAQQLKGSADNITAATTSLQNALNPPAQPAG